MDYVRGLPTLAVLAACALLVGSTYTIMGVTGAPNWVRIATIVVGLCIALVIEAFKLFEQRKARAAAEKEAEAERIAAEVKWTHDVEACLRTSWPPPVVKDISPFDIGVRRSGLAERASRTPGTLPYVARDVDERAKQRLQRSGLLLLIGEPASGVTRTAYELALARVPSFRMIAPLPPDGLRRAFGDLDLLSRNDLEGSFVLWLDRIHDFGKSGVTVSMLRRCRKGFPGTRFIATVPSGIEYTQWATDNPEVAQEFGDPVVVPRLPSPREKEEAQAAYRGVDFSEGIAAGFKAITALLIRLNAGYDSCPYEPAGGMCDLARSVVTTAIQWTGTGTPRGLPLDVATALVSHSNQDIPSRKHIDVALDWATARLPEGVSLITIDGQDSLSVLRPESELSAAWLADDSEFPPALWMAAIDDAVSAGDSEAIGRIGFQAHITDEHEYADRAWDQITTVSEPATAWLNRAIEYSRQHLSPVDAIYALQRLLALKEEAYGPNRIEVATTLEFLGITEQRAGQHETARDHLYRALTVREGVYGPDDASVATTLTNLGDSEVALGRFGIARDLLQRALEIKESALGPHDTSVAITLSNLGNAEHGLGHFEIARDLLQRALAIDENVYGSEDTRIAGTLTNLGLVERSLGHFEIARDLLQRALAIKESVDDPDLVSVATTLQNLGNAELSLGHFEIAQSLMQRSLDIKQRANQFDSRSIAPTLASLGNVAYALGQHEKACELLQRALAMNEGVYGPDSAITAGTLTDLGLVQIALGWHEDARDLLQRALAIKLVAYSADNPSVALTLTNLGRAEYALGAEESALEAWTSALRIYRLNGRERSVARVLSLLRLSFPDFVVIENRALPQQEAGSADS